MILLSGAWSTVQAETVYKGTDPQGTPEFSDNPFPGSEAIKLKPLQTYEAPPVPKEALAPPAEEKQATNYQISITTPENNQTFNVDITAVPVTFEISPALEETDQIDVYLNDKLYTTTTQSTLSLPDLYRGAYQLQAKIVAKDEDHTVKAESNVITFYQQRAFVRKGGS